MNKEFTLCLVLVVIGGGGYVASQQYHAHEAKLALQQQQAAAQTKAHQAAASVQATAAQAEEQRKLEAANASKAPKPPEPPTAGALLASDFKSLKISSILLGAPNMAIINKKNYEEGDSVASASGKKAKISQIKAEGIVLTCDGTSFQIDLPTARDLGNAAK